MAFNIRQPSNITNLFGNWLNGVAKKEKSHIEFMCVLCFGRYEMCVTVVSLTKNKKLPIFFAGYSFGYALDPYAPGYAYWVCNQHRNSTAGAVGVLVVV
jgi:hypothetical protein